MQFVSRTARLDINTKLRIPYFCTIIICIVVTALAPMIWGSETFALNNCNNRNPTMQYTNPPEISDSITTLSVFNINKTT